MWLTAWIDLGKAQPEENFVARHTKPTTIPPMDEEVEILREASVNGVFATRDAEKAGIPRLRLVDLGRQGRLTHLTRGMWSTVHPENSTEEHLLRTVAVIRRHRRQSGATGHSALVLHDLPCVDADLTRVHLIRGAGKATRQRDDYTVWGHAIALNEVTRPPFVDQPVWCAPVATAIAHAGVAGTPRTALVGADAAVHRGLVTPTQLKVAAASLPGGTPGAAAVRRALDGVDGRHESPGETLTAQILRKLGFVVEPQVWIGPYRVDFLITGSRVIVEFDGAVKYDRRADLIAEKRREDDLRRRGYVVVRLMWSDLKQSGRVRMLLESALRLPAA